MRGPVGDEALGADGLLVVLVVEDPVLQPALHVEDWELLVVVSLQLGGRSAYITIPSVRPMER